MINPPALFKRSYSISEGQRTEGVIRADLSRGQSLYPIPVINELGGEAAFPTFYVYASERVEDREIPSKYKIGCECPPGGCKRGSCPCIDSSSITLHSDGRVKDAFLYVSLFTNYKLCECDPTICACQADCLHRMTPFFELFQHKVEIFKDAVKGYCGRTQKGYGIRRGEFVCEFIGEVLDADEVGRRDQWEIGEYSMEVPAESDVPFSINPYTTSNVSRFFTHSCYPNLVHVRYFSKHRYGERPQVGLVASRDIPPMTELSIDYGPAWWIDGGSRGFRCACGWDYCRYRRLGVARQLTNAQLHDEEVLKRRREEADRRKVLQLRGMIP